MVRITLRPLVPGLYHAALRMPVALGPAALQANCYVAVNAAGLHLFDCGSYGEFPTLLRALAEMFPAKPVRAVYLTHGHADHCGAALPLLGLGAPLLASPEDLPLFRNGGPAGVPKAFTYPPFSAITPLYDRDMVAIQDVADFQVLHAPGHTAGSLCFFDRQNRILITGDLLIGPMKGHLATYALEVLTAKRQPPVELERHLASLAAAEAATANGSGLLVLPGHGPPFHTLAKPGEFQRTARILKQTLRKKQR